MWYIGGVYNTIYVPYIHLFYIQKYHLYTHKRPENIRKKNDNGIYGGVRYIFMRAFNATRI